MEYQKKLRRPKKRYGTNAKLSRERRRDRKREGSPERVGKREIE